MARAELVERAALDHRQIAAGLALGRPPVGPAGQRHVGRIAGEIEAVDGAAHHLLLPVIVEIGQQRGARSAHRRMDIAVDPRGGHARFLDIVFGGLLLPRFVRMCRRRPPGARVGCPRQGAFSVAAPAKAAMTSFCIRSSSPA